MVSEIPALHRIRKQTTSLKGHHLLKFYSYSHVIMETSAIFHFLFNVQSCHFYRPVVLNYNFLDFTLNIDLQHCG